MPKENLCPELEDIGGALPLQFDDDRAMLRAAAEALATFGGREPNSDRHARLILMAGFLFGMSERAQPARKAEGL